MRRVLIVSLLTVAMTALAQQRGAPTIPRQPFGNGPFTFDTAEQHKIRVAVVTKGLSHPWGLAFLPDGAMLITERAGRIRDVRQGPDGLLYVLTEEDDAALLRIEPAS